MSGRVWWLNLTLGQCGGGNFAWDGQAVLLS